MVIGMINDNNSISKATVEKAIDHVIEYPSSQMRYTGMYM